MSMNINKITIKDRKQEKEFIIQEMSAMTVLMKFLPMLFKNIRKDELVNSLNLVLQTADVKDDVTINNITPLVLITDTIYEILSNASLDKLQDLYNLILSHVKVLNGAEQIVSIDTNIDLYVKSPVVLGKLIYEVLKFTFAEVYNDFLELTGENSQEAQAKN
jgi:hypothetical protein